MTSVDDEISLDESYDDFPRIEEAFQRALDESLNPRGPETLFELIAELDLPELAFAVDVGCGEGQESLALAKRFGFAVHGVDPVTRHIELSKAAAQRERLDDRVQFSLGAAERLPVDDAAANLVFCKEVLMYADLDRAFGEFARVMKPDGYGFVYQVLTGPRMSDDEAAQFWSGLGASASSVRPADIEAAINRAGFDHCARIDFASEWGERAQEDAGAGGRRLVHAARLLRAPDHYIAQFGDAAYRIMLGDCLWHVYRMIGKLHGAAFIFANTT